MNCLHGLGVSHVFVDLLMLIPFVGMLVMWIKSLRHKCKKELCPICGSSDQLKDHRPVEFISPVTNEKAVISDVEFNMCDDCGENWQTVEQFKTFQQKVVDSGHNPSENS